jgi:hypothetical protein
VQLIVRLKRLVAALFRNGVFRSPSTVLNRHITAGAGELTCGYGFDSNGDVPGFHKDCAVTGSWFLLFRECVVSLTAGKTIPSHLPKLCTRQSGSQPELSGSESGVLSFQIDEKDELGVQIKFA